MEILFQAITPSHVNVNSIKCNIKIHIDVKDKEISYKRNHKLFINTLNSREIVNRGIQIGDYVDFISVMIQGIKCLSNFLSKIMKNMKLISTLYKRILM